MLPLGSLPSYFLQPSPLAPVLPLLESGMTSAAVNAPAEARGPYHSCTAPTHSLRVLSHAFRNLDLQALNCSGDHFTPHSLRRIPLLNYSFRFRIRLMAAFQTAPSLLELFPASRVIGDAARISSPPSHVFSSRAQASLILAPPPSNTSRPLIFFSSQPFQHTLR